MPKTHRTGLPLLAVLLTVLAAPQRLHAQQALDNAAVMQLAASGKTEDQIVQTIAASAGHYVLGTDALAAFRQAGVTDKEVDAMRKKNADMAAAAAEVGTVVPPGVHDVGVYYKDPRTDAWVQFKPELYYYILPTHTSPLGTPVPAAVRGVAIAGQLAGGVIAAGVGAILLPFDIAYAISHAKHDDRSAFISGKTAQLAFSHPVDFLIYAPEDTGPKDYRLLKLRERPDNPDVRVFERSGAANIGDASKRDRQNFTATKLGFRFYQFTLGEEIKPGEYAILLPDAAAPANAPGRGEILTFRVVE